MDSTHDTDQDGNIGPFLAIGLSNYVLAHHHGKSLDDPTIGYGPNATLNYSGGFAPNSAIRFRDVTDGTSSTLMVGERAYLIGPVIMGAALWAGTPTGFSGDATDDLFFSARTQINPLNNTNSGHRQEAISSQHPGGAQVCLFDGSVRLLSENIYISLSDPDYNRNDATIDSIYEKLIAISDGSPIGEF